MGRDSNNGQDVQRRCHGVGAQGAAGKDTAGWTGRDCVGVIEVGLGDPWV